MRALILLLAATLFAMPAHAVIAIASYTVDTTDDTPDVTTTDGRCLDANGRCSLRAAVTEANEMSFTIIIVPAGTYTLTRTGAGEDSAATGDLDIASETMIVGAGVGKTIINTGGLDRAFEVLSPIKATISGVSITGGNAAPGGAIRVLADGALSLISSRVYGNQSSSTGGALTVEGSAVLSDCVIEQNVASSGGAIALPSLARLTLLRSTVSGNTATIDGGAISASTGSLLLVQDSALTSNAASAGRGGAMYLLDKTLATVERSFIGGNSAGSAGGGIAVTNAGVLRVLDSTIYGNTAQTIGGGVSALTIGTPITFEHVTVVGNTAPTGGGIATVDSNSRFGYTIISANSPVNCSLSVTVVSEGGNIDSGTSCGLTAATDRQSTDPVLAALSASGRLSGLEPLAGSPALDTRDAAGCRAVDAFGTARPTDGDRDGVAKCDSGALEHEVDTALIQSVASAVNTLRVRVNAVTSKNYKKTSIKTNLKTALDGFNASLTGVPELKPGSRAFETIRSEVVARVTSLRNVKKKKDVAARKSAAAAVVTELKNAL